MTHRNVVVDLPQHRGHVLGDGRVFRVEVQRRLVEECELDVLQHEHTTEAKRILCVRTPAQEQEQEQKQEAVHAPRRIWIWKGAVDGWKSGAEARRAVTVFEEPLKILPELVPAVDPAVPRLGRLLSQQRRVLHRSIRTTGHCSAAGWGQELVSWWGQGQWLSNFPNARGGIAPLPVPSPRPASARARCSTHRPAPT